MSGDEEKRIDHNALYTLTSVPIYFKECIMKVQCIVLIGVKIQLMAIANGEIEMTK